MYSRKLYLNRSKKWIKLVNQMITMNTHEESYTNLISQKKKLEILRILGRQEVSTFDIRSINLTLNEFPMYTSVLFRD